MGHHKGLIVPAIALFNVVIGCRAGRLVRCGEDFVDIFGVITNFLGLSIHNSKSISCVSFSLCFTFLFSTRENVLCFVCDM